jgi:hypothetical protein
MNDRAAQQRGGWERDARRRMERQVSLGHLAPRVQAAEEWQAAARTVNAIRLTPRPRRSGIARMRHAVGAPLIWLGQRLQGVPGPTTGVASNVMPSANR